MLATEVIDRSDQIHCPLQPLRHPTECARPPMQRREVRPKRQIESFNERRVEDATAFDFVANRFKLLSRPLDDPPTDRRDSFADVLLDDLRQIDARPRNKRRTTSLAGLVRLPKDLTNRRHVTAQPIGAEERRAAEGATFDSLDHSFDQAVVAARPDFATEPESAADHHGHRHPPDLPLRFDAQFVALDFIEFTPLLDEMLVDGLGLRPGALLP